ncbi:MAG: hypothetical protein NT150_03730 [Bacteroidetes bacterium]|nr:hypothetical protein [Bacteroidota bacterium]
MKRFALFTLGVFLIGLFTITSSSAYLAKEVAMPDTVLIGN